MANIPKRLTVAEKRFAARLAAGEGSIQAARKVFGWRCEPYTKEAQKAKDLARSKRIVEEKKRVEAQQKKEAIAQTLVDLSSKIDMIQLKKFAYDRLLEIRDDPTIPSGPRWTAIQALEKLSDPAKDINLIWRYVDLLWKGYEVHCPCCHETFPLREVKNEKLDQFREDYKIKKGSKFENTLERRLFVLSEAEKRRIPHETQKKALAAPERHLVGMGAARAGKSFLLSMFGILYFLIPGVEIWILAQTYDEARSEMEYLEDFLNTLFYPVSRYMFNKIEDKKSGEVAITSRWGSEVRIKSGRAKSSITGRELEAALVAEPAWVEADLYEEVRARMSSRLGRIIALGTPKGFGGFIHRMVRLGNRTISGRRIKPEDRLIENGCAWGKSILILNLAPKDNPEYVQSEIETAKEELTEEEFAAEFEGVMATAEGARFPHIKEEHIRKVTSEEYNGCEFVLGVDQGEKNFGSTLIGWNGHTAYVAREFFDNSNTTTKANMIQLNQYMPGMVRILGNRTKAWEYTIFDADPPVWNILDELEEEGRPWKTAYTYRPKNKPEYIEWREETMMWVNELAKSGKLIFDEECDLLHEQLMEALRVPPDRKSEKKKGWIIKDLFRGEHVADAFLMAMWLISTDFIYIEEERAINSEPWEEARKAFEYNIASGEERDLTGFKPSPNSDLFEDVFGRSRGGKYFIPSSSGYYPDES